MPFAKRCLVGIELPRFREQFDRRVSTELSSGGARLPDQALVDLRIAALKRVLWLSAKAGACPRVDFERAPEGEATR